MNSFEKLFKIDREFHFTGQMDEFNARLNKLNGINHAVVKDREIKFSPYFSLGTMAINDNVGLVDGINVKALVSDIDSDRLKVKLKTTVRPEHYFIIALFILFIIAIIVTDESKWLIIYVLGLWPVCHAWFQFIFRIQENHLIEKIVSKFRLREM